MALRPRIKPVAPTDESAVAAIINRGGAPAPAQAFVQPEPEPPPAAPAEPEDPEKKFTLRLPASLLAAIEKDAKSRPDRISVNSWLIGAALQRLERIP